MYQEDKFKAAPYRKRVLDETNAYIESLRAEADARRADYFRPDFTSVDAYQASTESYRRDLIAMLGRPLTEMPDTPPTNARRLTLEDSDDGRIERLWVECLPGVWSYGLLFTPAGEGKKPYVTALHGGLGTPEIVTSLYNSGNYNDLARRIGKATGAIIYAPQLILWGEGYNTSAGEKQDHLKLDYAFKQLGGSIAAFEICKIMRTVDWLCANLPIDTDRMGIAGLSYGGFYTLFTAVCDTRYKAALSSGFFNNRYDYCWADWQWFGAAQKLLDSEAARLVCPRVLCVEVGEADELFRADSARKEAEAVREAYERLGIGDKFRFHVHPGPHEFDRDNGSVEWFAKHLLEG